MRKCLKNIKKKLETKNDDMAADVAQRECNKIKCYALTFSNI